MEEFVSEAIAPIAGTPDARAMGRGEPGLPAGFVWRGQTFTIQSLLRRWKETSAEASRAGGDVYLRRHVYILLMDNGTVWWIYCLRQSPRSGNPRSRWFLYTITHPDAGEPRTANRAARNDDRLEPKALC